MTPCVMLSSDGEGWGRRLAADVPEILAGEPRLPGARWLGRSHTGFTVGSPRPEQGGTGQGPRIEERWPGNRRGTDCPVRPFPRLPRCVGLREPTTPEG